MLLASLIVGLALAVSPVDLSALGLGDEVDRVQVGDRLYVALAGGGVAIVDVRDPQSPVLKGRFAEGRRVDGLLVNGNTLYLLETRHELSAFDVGRPEAPVPTAIGPGLKLPPSTAAAPREETPPSPPASAQASVQASAKVVDVRDGRAIFDAGAASGLTNGKHVRIVSQRLESKPDLATGKTVRVPSGELTAVVRIEHADEQRSMARLGRGDVVEIGDLVSLTTEPLSESLFLPRRAPFNFLAGFHVRPFLGLGGASKEVGLLSDLYASWYLDSLPLALSVSASPIGLALNSTDAHYPSTLTVTAAYTTDFFEIGLGGGALIGNRGPCFQPPLGAEACEINTGATINQVLRLGALDGINVVWRSSIFARPEEFVFGVGRGELNLPLTSQLGLFGAGGGGENGWNFGEFGVRTYLGGTGARGTTIISASLGYASVFDGPIGESVGGPSVAFGMEWRL